MYILVILWTVWHMSSAAIFSIDQRQEINQLSSAWQMRAQAVAVALPSQDLIPSSTDSYQHYSFNGPRYGEREKICPEERFVEQTSYGHCTAFLVHPRVVLTAGHCLLARGEIINQENPYCDNFAFWFDYNNKNPRHASGEEFPVENVARCKKVIYAVLSEAIRPEDSPMDFALLELEKPIEHITPLKLVSTELGRGKPLGTIGHPHGLPAKFSGWDYRRQEKRESTTYSAFLDTLAGNSGGPVFNKEGQVVGVLTNGHQFDTYRSGQCNRINTCNAVGRSCQRDSELLPQNLILRSTVIWPFLQNYLSP